MGSQATLAVPELGQCVLRHDGLFSRSTDGRLTKVNQFELVDQCCCRCSDEYLATENAAHTPSPVCLNNQPSCRSIAARTTSSLLQGLAVCPGGLALHLA